MLLKKEHYISLVTALIILVGLIASAAFSCTGQKKTEMRVLCAGSLMVPFTEIEAAFESEHPDIDLLIEGHGSIQVIRHVTELFEESDIMAVADHSLIPMLMYNTTVPDTDESYASWSIKFATNSLGIAYTPSSLYSGEINAQNWYEILARPDVRLGISDARLDACGYRAFMLLKMAEKYYGDSTIFNEVLGPFNPTIKLEPEGTTTTILVPEVLHPVDERIVLRGSSIRMLALLDSGDIDYAFEYRSVAEQHKLEFLELPPEINMGETGYGGLYENVICELDFHRFSSVQPVFAGEPIIYGITVPYIAPHPDEAVSFIEFLLSDAGRQIFLQNHQPQLVPFEADNIDSAPSELRSVLAGL
ncbi:MAG: tungstate ABC transporter substrate-binding protein WtpA [Dehalococcoidia bacterium]